MTYDPEEHDRHSIRLRGYDYTPSGAYLITICIQNRKSLFGNIVHGAMHLNDAGRMVENIWNALPILHPGLETDEFIVKLNRLYGIIFIAGSGFATGPIDDKRDDGREIPIPGLDQATTRGDPTKSQNIGDIVGGFKSWVTVE